MSSNVEWALGDHMEYGDGGSPTETFTLIPEIRSISFNLGTRTLVDTTHHESTAPFRDNIATFLEGGTIQLEGNLLPGNAAQEAIEAMRANDLATTFRRVITMENGNIRRYTGKARVTAFNSNHDAADARRLSITLAPTGEWVKSLET